jgi:hypothetical protein
MSRAVVIATLACASFAGCGEPSPFRVELKSSQRWVASPDAEERLRRLAVAAARYWGGSEQSLGGWALVVVDGMVSCSGRPAVGCVDPRDRGIVVSATDNIASPSVVCAEATSVAHEVGHAVIGDTGHVDPRWDRQALNELAHALVPGDDLECDAWFDGVVY